MTPSGGHWRCFSFLRFNRQMPALRSICWHASRLPLAEIEGNAASTPTPATGRVVRREADIRHRLVRPPRREEKTRSVLTLSLADLSRSQTSRVPANPALQEEQSLARVPIKVPICLYWGYVVIVEESIGDLQKLNFQVDTGVYPSVLDQKIAQKLGLQKKAARVNLSKRSVDGRTKEMLFGPMNSLTFSAPFD